MKYNLLILLTILSLPKNLVWLGVFTKSELCQIGRGKNAIQTQYKTTQNAS